MIKKLFDCGCFDYVKFILSHQKELLLKPDAAVVLIHMLDEYKKDKNFTLSPIQQELALSDSEFDTIVTNLAERKYYCYYLQGEDGVEHEAISLDGFFDRVKEIVEDSKPIDIENELFVITQKIQQGINRLLTAEELEIVSSLITDDGFKESDIEEALEYMKNHFKVLSVKNLITSLNRYREKEVKHEETPDFVKSFFERIR